MKSLEGKTAFVTGAASGIGLGIATADLQDSISVVGSFGSPNNANHLVNGPAFDHSLSDRILEPRDVRSFQVIGPVLQQSSLERSRTDSSRDSLKRHGHDSH